VRYDGGKNGAGVYQTIINNIPPHSTYIEPFAGSAGVFRRLRRAARSVLIDADAATIQALRADPEILTTGPAGRAIVLRTDAISYLRKHRHSFTPDTFIYLDPPYLMSTRSCKKQVYRHEFHTEREHRLLLDLIRCLPCMVMISGYPSRLYASRLREWRTVTYQAQTRSGRPRTECLWMNYPEPMALQDYAYIGRTYRQREVYKRKLDRWERHFRTLPPILQRAAMDRLSLPDAGNQDWNPDRLLSVGLQCVRLLRRRGRRPAS